jgi:hypothetical protein
MIEKHYASEDFENFLWVRHGDYQSGIDGDRLHSLLHGATPENDAEQMLVDNPKWLRIYLNHVIGEYPITISPEEPLPGWDPMWLDSVEG